MFRKIICILFVTLTAFSPLCTVNAADVSAQAAVVIDIDNGRVYYEKNADTVLPMASTTKIMTALVVLESGLDLDEYFTVDSNAIMVEGSSMGLQKGDRVTLRTLCYGMLLSSGNDAANAAAVRVGGSIEGFCRLMNERAKEMGLVNTSFQTPSGLDDEKHHTTAKELATVTWYAMKNDDFKNICNRVTASVEFGNPPYKRTLYNHNRLLRTYEGTIGVKTGFTKKSGRCLVSAAERNGVGLICVTLNAPNDWSDHTKLYNEYFDSLAKLELDEGTNYVVKVTGGTTSSVNLVPSTTPVATLAAGELSRVEKSVVIAPFAYAPVNCGDVMGEVVYTLDSVELARVDLVAQTDVKRLTTEKNGFQKFLDGLFGWIKK